MGAISKREYKGESELEYYGLLSPDDCPEVEDELYCESCGDPTDELFETNDMVMLCKPCYDLCVEESEEECEN